MTVSFTKQFSAQLDKVHSKALLAKVRAIVQAVMLATDMQNTPNLKKLKGHPSAYRIRTGNYRIGIFIETTNVIFAILAHRKDIYNQFP
jgi:mRNA interferase RelE/StbE